MSQHSKPFPNAKEFAERFWKKFEVLDEYDARMKLRGMMMKVSRIDNPFRLRSVEKCCNCCKHSELNEGYSDLLCNHPLNPAEKFCGKVERDDICDLFEKDKVD